jgi:hypothetical protein
MEPTALIVVLEKRKCHLMNFFFLDANSKRFNLGNWMGPFCFISSCSRPNHFLEFTRQAVEKLSFRKRTLFKVPLFSEDWTIILVTTLRAGADIRSLKKSYGEGFRLDEIEEALKKHHPTFFFLTHGESSATVAHPLDGIGPLCHKYGTIFGVDTVASLGGAPFEVPAWIPRKNDFTLHCRLLLVLTLFGSHQYPGWIWVQRVFKLNTVFVLIS